MEHSFFMKEALKEAAKALKIKEVPIGCVIVFDGIIIGRGYNRRTVDKNSLKHAEIIAINEACAFMGDWRLENCHIFVTVEPCPMCAGAILQARMKSLCFGTKNKKAGACGSVIDIFTNNGFNHTVEVKSEIMAQECGELMSGFFAGLRKGEDLA
ncbi:MAG: nucleoside deaminase [Defluviitaleaceae bacterium]|nr:nucleoside deaminase [Defluviitaleaceae bacterium]